LTATTAMTSKSTVVTSSKLDHDDEQGGGDGKGRQA